MAEIARKFIENWEYYRVQNAKLSVHFEDVADIVLLPGFNFSGDNIVHREKEEGEAVVIQWRTSDLGVYPQKNGDGHFVRWFDEGTPHRPETVEIQYPEGWDDGE